MFPKGKQPAKKVTSKRPAVANSNSSDEVENEDQLFILQQLAAMERARGLSPGGPRLFLVMVPLTRGGGLIKVLRNSLKQRFITSYHF